MNPATNISDFGALIRGELDIENLLRHTLEFILAKAGPTNAAVFLPTTSGDYSLGAYVNYDCPKETVDVLLDHLANTVAPRFEGLVDVLHMCDAGEIEEHVGDDAGWLEDSGAMAFTCRHEGETLAIVLLFRDARHPFDLSLPGTLRTVAGAFADQLARVIRIHHRHLPKHKWGAPGDPEPRDENGDEDLAA